MGFTGFDGVAELYARVRPTYPDVLFDEVTAFAGPPGRALEIGCGTGQATRPLAERGWAVHALELGPTTAAVARRVLADLPGVRVEVGDFDTWDGEPGAYDLVFAATAFHWLDPATRLDRSARLLRPGGALATIATHHVTGGTSAFFVEVQDVYERFDPATPPGLRPRAAAEVPPDDPGASDRFGPPAYRRAEWTVTYRTADYLDLLRTYSPTIALPPEARAGLLDGIAALLDGRFGGVVDKHYVAELRLARRLP